MLLGTNNINSETWMMYQFTMKLNRTFAIEMLASFVFHRRWLYISEKWFYSIDNAGSRTGTNTKFHAEQLEVLHKNKLT